MNQAYWIGDCRGVAHPNTLKSEVLRNAMRSRPVAHFQRTDQIVRAPTLWNADFMRAAHFFDEVQFYQAFDEPDLCQRAEAVWPGAQVGYVSAAVKCFANLRTTIAHPKNKSHHHCSEILKAQKQPAGGCIRSKDPDFIAGHAARLATLVAKEPPPPPPPLRRQCEPIMRRKYGGPRTYRIDTHLY